MKWEGDLSHPQNPFFVGGCDFFHQPQRLLKFVRSSFMGVSCRLGRQCRLPAIFMPTPSHWASSHSSLSGDPLSAPTQLPLKPGSSPSRLWPPMDACGHGTDIREAPTADSLRMGAPQCSELTSQGSSPANCGA